jgi:hypothetical protein
VFIEVKNVMAIEAIPIIVMLDDDDMSMELAVELAMDIAEMVLVGDPDADIVMPGIDMLSISI